MDFNLIIARDFIQNFEIVVANSKADSKRLTDLSRYEIVRKNLESIADRTFGSLTSKVHFYGSRVIGVASEESDLDIFVEIDGNFSSSYDISSKNDQRFNMMEMALHDSGDWQVEKSILKTDVPLFITVFRPLKLDCDVILTNGLSICTSNLLAHMFVIQPEAVSLFHFVRKWLKAQGFEHLKGYVLTLLVVYYLQSINMMPTVQRIQMDSPKEIVAGWEVQFNPNKTLASYGCTTMEDYKQHIREFFRFYSRFDYSKVILTYNGTAVDAYLHQRRHLKFLNKGILIVGPINQSRNCGVIDYSHKQQFINLIKVSSKFFDETVF